MLCLQGKSLCTNAIYPTFRYTPEPEDTSEIVCVLNCVIYHTKILWKEDGECEFQNIV